MRSSITEYVPNDTVKQWISEIAVDSTVSTDIKSWLSDVTTAIINNKLSKGGNVEVYILDNNLNEPSEELIKELKTT